jgi:hypothetical protein
MAKLAFSKLGLKKNEPVKVIKINEQDVEVKTYLPVEEKLNIIKNVLEKSADDNNFSNPVKIEVFANLEIVYAYTNLSFTDKQKETPHQLYDLLETNGVFDMVAAAISNEYTTLIDWINEMVESFYKQRNSVLGILEQVSADYSNLSLEATEIQKKLADPNNLTLVKDILTKLG